MLLGLPASGLGGTCVAGHEGSPHVPWTGHSVPSWLPESTYIKISVHILRHPHKDLRYTPKNINRALTLVFCAEGEMPDPACCCRNRRLLPRASQANVSVLSLLLGAFSCRENQALWKEVASLRQKHSQQQQLLSKVPVPPCPFSGRLVSRHVWGEGVPAAAGSRALRNFHLLGLSLRFVRSQGPRSKNRWLLLIEHVAVVLCQPHGIFNKRSAQWFAIVCFHVVPLVFLGSLLSKP